MATRLLRKKDLGALEVMMKTVKFLHQSQSIRLSGIIPPPAANAPELELHW